MGQRLGVPVAELLGGRVRGNPLIRQLPVLSACRTKGRARAVARRRSARRHAKALQAEHGFGTQAEGRRLRTGLRAQRLSVVAAALPKDRFRYDLNSAFSLADAIRFGQGIADINNDYYEDPVFGMPQLSRLREFVRIPIATNTVVVNFEQLAMNVTTQPRAVDVVLLDTTFWGGIRPCIKGSRDLRHLRPGRRGTFVGRARHPARDHAAHGRRGYNLGYAADAHYHHLVDDIIVGGKMKA